MSKTIKQLTWRPQGQYVSLKRAAEIRVEWTVGAAVLERDETPHVLAHKTLRVRADVEQRVAGRIGRSPKRGPLDLWWFRSTTGLAFHRSSAPNPWGNSTVDRVVTPTPDLPLAHLFLSRSLRSSFARSRASSASRRTRSRSSCSSCTARLWTAPRRSVTFSTGTSRFPVAVSTICVP